MASNSTAASTATAHRLGTIEDDDYDYDVPDLFVCLDECYIYSIPGDDQGNPTNGARDISYDTVPDEIIKLDTTRREGKYVRCILPLEGWVFLPDENREYDDPVLNEIYDKKKKEFDLLKERKENEESKNEEKEESKNDEELKDDDLKNIDEEYDENNYLMEERRVFAHQRMMTHSKPWDDENHEIDIMRWFGYPIPKWLLKIIYFFRRHPYLPGLIVSLWDVAWEATLPADIISDIGLLFELSNNLPVFTLSCIFMLTPYIIAWRACCQMGARKLSQHPDNLYYIIAVTLFDIPPLGMMVLMLLDVYYWIECVLLSPLFYVVTFGKELRNISYEEEGFHKLRGVSEIFAESLPQTFLQLYLLTGGRGCSECELQSIIIAFIFSCISICKWSYVIYTEAKENGVSVIEYTCVIFQGSFDFVPYLPAIEKGTASGEKVNWSDYKLSADASGYVRKSLSSKNCKLKNLKISGYTLKDINRFTCKFIGTGLQNVSNLIISRRKEDIMKMFYQFDIDNTKSLDLDNFIEFGLVNNKQTQKPLLRSDICLLFREVADGVSQEIWLLDMLLQANGSLDRIALFDYEYPLRYFYESSNLKMISLLMGYQYDKISEKNKNEFEYCVSNAITNGKIREALCLCEHKGIPLVVSVEEGKNLLVMDDDGISDPYVTVSIFEQIQKTNCRKETLNPNWFEDLLFIVPFEYMDRLLHVEKYLKDTDYDKSMTAIIAANVDKNKPNKSQIPQSFAIDITSSTVTGYKLPNYCEKAIQKHLEDTYKKPFNFNYIGSVIDLNKAVSDANDNNNNDNFVSDDNNNDNFKIDDITSESDVMLNDNAVHKPRSLFGDKSGKLTIRFRVFNLDLNDEDDYMGSYKTKIIMNNDTENYHKKKQTVNLQPPVGYKNAGDISYRVFLNAVQIYQDHTLHYIDEMKKEDKPIDIFDAKVTNEPIAMQGVFQM